MPASDEFLSEYTVLQRPGYPQPFSHAGRVSFLWGSKLPADPKLLPMGLTGTRVLKNLICSDRCSSSKATAQHLALKC